MRNELNLFTTSSANIFGKIKTIHPSATYALDDNQQQPQEAFAFLDSQPESSTVELIGHAGHSDELLEQRSSLNLRRENDAQFFASSVTKQGLKTRNIQLIDYTEL